LHVITAAVTDSGGAGASDAVTIRVGTPILTVTAGLVARHESTDAVATDGNIVTAWSDLSGAGNHLTAIGGPPLVLALTPSGLPAIALDGSNDKLERIHSAATPLNGLPLGNSDRTILVVARYLSSTWAAGAVYGSPRNNSSFGPAVKHPTGVLMVMGFGAAHDLVSSTPGIGAGWLLQDVVHQAGATTMSKDGVSIASWTHTYATTRVKFVIGEEIKKNGLVKMDVAAILLYDRALSSPELDEVRAYLREKYLTAPSPP
jgi:hypothetical protein